MYLDCRQARIHVFMQECELLHINISQSNCLVLPVTKYFVFGFKFNIFSSFIFFQFISAKVRELLGIEEPYWNRSITLPHREPKSLYLERKSQTGTDVDGLTYAEHLRELNRLNQHGVPRQHDVSW